MNLKRPSPLSILVLLLGATMLLAAGCSDTDSDDVSPPVGKKDKTDAGTFSVNEAGITATLGASAGDSVGLQIPITATAALSGTVTASIEHLDGTTLTTASRSFTATPGSQTIMLDLAADGLPPRGQAEVGLVVHYRLVSGDASAEGYRSLFYVLPQFDLRVRLPGSLTEGQKTAIRVFALNPLTNEPAAGVAVSLRIIDARRRREDGNSDDGR